MDKGAHFNQCDFQVHTPRDLAWTGRRPLSKVERLRYGHDFIAACRNKGLAAVAITDHHDMVMAKYIRQAALEETDEAGGPIPEDQRIIVYPGMELTLNVPCQALLILDSDFPDGLFTLVLDALAIPQPDESKKKSEAPDPLEDVKSLDDLYKNLDRHDAIRGRYIVLPHVKSSGHQTLLRKGSNKKYANMPCVGGYVDGNIESFGAGEKKIVAGLDKEWGNKKIAVLQTSDSRSSDFANLGKHTSWVKWATPTAEAIRQACLAPESRIVHELPVLPQTVIRSIRVSNSSFMGRIDLFLNPQYNALIGGRGTGKSTVLEYLRWAVADQHPTTGDEDDMPNYKVRSQKLIKDTLQTHDGVVDVEFEVNEIPHYIRRDSTTNEILLKIAEGEYEPCSEKDVRTLLPIQAYSQKQLSNVGIRLEELSNFVHAPIRDKLDHIDKSFGHLASELRQQYAQVERKRSLERVLALDELSLKSLGQRTSSIRKSIKGLTKDDQKLLDSRTYFDDVVHTIENWEEEIDSASESIEALSDSLEGLPSQTEVANDGPVSGKVLKTDKQVESLFEEVRSDIEQASRRIAEFRLPGSMYTKDLKALKSEIDKYDEKYNAAKKRSSAHETKLNELRELEQKQRELRKAISKYKAEISGLGNPETEYTRLRSDWREKHELRTALVKEECSRLTDRSGDDIKATLDIGAGLEHLIEKLRISLTGSGLRKQKYDSLLNHLLDAEDPVDSWDEVLTELESLAASVPSEEAETPLPETPALHRSGLTNGDLTKIRDNLSIESWIELALADIQDQPVFEYRKREGEYIDFDKASAGQQATALLKTLLNQPGPPLIIDQPEDDLDNPVIFEVVKQIWAAKSQRQLIFASHNANLVVNGDAELVVCFDHVVAGDRSGGTIKAEGAIDVPDICNSIKIIMEGGELAFKLRRDKYGF